MVTVNDLQRLQGLSGVTLLDAAADLVGMARPSELAKPITTARPEVLAERAAEWEAVGAKVRTQRESLQQHVDSVMNNWSGEAADSFRAYSGDLLRSLQAQESAVDAIPPVLAGMQECMTEAQRDWYDYVVEIASLLVAAVAAAVVTILTAPLVGPAAPLIGIAVGLIIALLLETAKYIGMRNRRREDCLAERKERMDRRTAQLRGTRARAVNPPADPVITGAGFSALDLPSQFGPTSGQA